MISKRINRIETSFREYLKLLESTTNVGQEVIAFEHDDYDLFVQYSELLKNEGKEHKWDIIKKYTWDRYMMPGSIFVVAPYKDSQVASLLFRPDGQILGVDNNDRPLLNEDIDEFIKSIGNTVGLAKNPSHRIDLYARWKKLRAKMKLSNLEDEFE